ncbi:hypothetical protein E2N92_11130 [Methanofollis formosanus]|uniref:Uncharacterized protein n=1 Tax=Methanofollis formosanus TaxID=299308 RepID=A0A8G1EH86_9EURY|nr:hypothetical protein [Methanofollis formosanus]QYZ79936.1 hypothetical protein E2N92_11130 [Methanofollis formosanus]
MGQKSFFIEFAVICLLIAAISIVAYTGVGGEEETGAAAGAASLQVQEHVEVVRGGAATVPVTLETGAGTVGEVRYTLCRVTAAEEKEQCPMPDGFSVGIDPMVFHAEPDTAYQAEMNLSACPECSPGAYVLMLDAGVASRWIEVTVV